MHSKLRNGCKVSQKHCVHWCATDVCSMWASSPEFICEYFFFKACVWVCTCGWVKKQQIHFFFFYSRLLREGKKQNKTKHIQRSIMLCWIQNNSTQWYYMSCQPSHSVCCWPSCLDNQRAWQSFSGTHQHSGAAWPSFLYGLTSGSVISFRLGCNTHPTKRWCTLLGFLDNLVLLRSP